MHYVTRIWMLLSRYGIGFAPGYVALGFQFQDTLMEFFVVPFANKKWLHLSHQ